MPDINEFTGNAQAFRDKWLLVLGNLETGDTIGARIGSKEVVWESRSDSETDGYDALLAKFLEAKDDELLPEWGETECEIALANDGISYLGIEVLGPVDGTPIILSPIGTDRGLRVSVTQVQAGTPGVNAKFRLTKINNPTGGTFTISWRGATTSAQAWNDSAANVKADLEALAPIGSGNVDVTAGTNFWDIEFKGTLANQTLPAPTTDGANLTFGVGVHTIGVETIRDGVPGVNQIVSFAIPMIGGGGTFLITINGETIGSAQAYNDTEAAITTDLEAMTLIASGDVTVSSEYSGNYRIINIEFKGQFSGGSIFANVTVDGTSLTNSLRKFVPVGLQSPAEAAVSYSVPVGAAFQIRFQHPTNGGVLDFSVPAGTSAPSIQVLLNAAAAASLPFAGAAFAVGSVFGVGYVFYLGGNLSGYPVSISPNPAAGVVGVSASSQYDLAVLRIYQQGSGSVKTIYRVTWTDPPLTGNFTLRVTRRVDNVAATTSNIAWPPTATSYAAALDALSNLSTVTVAEVGLNTFDIEFNDVGVNYLLEIASYGTVSGVNVQPSTSQQPVAGISEIKRVSITSGAVGGTFTMTNNGETTGNIARAATAPVFQAAIEALTTPVPGDVSVSGPAGGPWLVAYAGAFKWTNLGDSYLTGTGTNLTGGSVDVGLIQAAMPKRDEIQRISLTASTGGTFNATWGSYTTPGIPYSASSSIVQGMLGNLTSIGVANMLVTGGAGGPWDCRFTGTLGGAPQSMIVCDGALLTGVGAQTVTVENTEPGTSQWHADDPNNWSLGHVPIDGERIYIPPGRQIKYGMIQIGVAPERIIYAAGAIGAGLPDWNPLGYAEYRNPNWQIYQAATLITVDVGEGDDGGPVIVRHDFGTGYINLRCLAATGSGNRDDGPAVRVIGGAANANARVEAIRGSVGLAWKEGEVCNINDLVISYLDDLAGDAVVEIGAGATIVNVKKEGGTAWSRATGFTLAHNAGTFTQERTGGTIPTFAQVGGTVIIHPTTTISDTTPELKGGTLQLMGGGGRVNFGGPLLHYKGAVFVDPQKRSYITSQNYMRITYIGTSPDEDSLGIDMTIEITR